MPFSSLRKSFSQLNRTRSTRQVRSNRDQSLHAVIESLEGRQLLTSNVSIGLDNALAFAVSSANNNLTISYDGGTDTYTLTDPNDTITLVANDGTAVVNGSTTNTMTVSGISSLSFDNNGGSDTYNIRSIADPFVLTNSTASDNTVNIGFGGTTAAIQASITTSNLNAKTLLRVLDSNNATAHVATLSNSGLTGVTSSPIFFNASQLNLGFLQLGNGGIDLTVGTTTLGGPVSITTGSGSDTVRFQDSATLAGGGIDAGSGTNTLDYSAYTTGVIANLNTGAATGTSGATNFQNATGGSGPDTLTSPDGVASTLMGGPGADVLTAGSGNGTLIGGTGNDILNGTTGNTTFVWNNGDNSDVINGTNSNNTVVVNGANAAGDIFSLISNGSRSTFARTNLVPFTLDIERFNTMLVNGQAGDDSFTVDFSAGNPVGTSNLFFDGGLGADTLNLKGGSFTNETYAPTPGVYGSGFVQLDSTVVNFANLLPINDTAGATNFNFNLPAGLNALAVLNGPTVGGTNTTRISSQAGSPTFELINIGNKTNVNLVTPTAGDTIVLNNSIPGAGMATLNITATGPGSSLRAFAAPNGVATNVFLGGSDVATVSAAGLPATGSFTVNGGPGINTLNVDGAGTVGAPIVGASTITVDGRVLNYFNFQTINLTNAASTPPSIVTVQPLTAVAGTPLVNQVVGTFVSNQVGLTAANFGATISWGDATTSAGVITQDASDPTLFYVSGSHTYQGGAASYPLVLSVRNLGGTTTTVVNGTTVVTQSGPSDPVTGNAQVTVADAAIVAQGVPVSAVENQAFTDVPVATFTVPDLGAVAGNYTATINWGDLGATSAGTITSLGVTPNGVTFLVSGSHNYLNEGNFTIRVQIASIGGSQALASSTAFVSDGAISVIGNAATATAGTPLANAIVAFVTDSGGIEAPNSYTASVNWGDGVAATTPIITLNGLNLAIQAGHTYSAPGNYLGTVTVRTAGGSVKTATFPITVAGLTASNLPVTATEDVALNRVPLVTLSSNGGPAAAANFYAASIDWGDATPITPGAVDSSLQVLGNHTYDEAGTYNVKITVSIDGNPNLLVFTRSLVVQDVPIIVTGTLDPNSDSGISNSDKITNVVQPIYTGKSEPLSTVTVYATPVGGGAAIVLGATTTDTAGAWQVHSNVALADGSYVVTAIAIDRNGATHGNGALGNITIDTIGPKVDYLTFNRMKGEIDLWLSDERTGLAQKTIIDNANYSLTKPHLRPGRLLFTSLNASAQTSPTAAQQVTGLINGGQPLRGSTYTFTAGDGITDVAGNHLDGEFYGYFPSGNNKPGGDFVAIIDTFHGKVFPAKPSQGFGTPNDPKGTLAQGYSIRNRELVADSKVTNLFPGQTPNGVYTTKRVVAQATPKAPAAKAAAAAAKREAAATKAQVKVQIARTAAQKAAAKPVATKAVAKPTVHTVAVKPAREVATAYDTVLANLARSRRGN